MSKKITTETIEKIVSLIDGGESDSEIAKKNGVSPSYVNKLRAWITKKKKLEAISNETKKSIDAEPENYVVEETGAINDVQLLELRIKALERTISFYRELIALKKKQALEDSKKE